MNTIPSPSRALVLGGGGSAGNAWLLGTTAGLAEAGVDVTGADVIFGTSAGATAAAQITGAPAADLLAAIIEAPPVQRPARASVRAGSVAEHMARTARLIAASADPADMRRRLGAAALELAAASPDAQTRWRETVARRLPRQDWPAQRMQLTTVDAETGDTVLLDRDSGVDLADAVAASCSSGFAYRIGERMLIDGGYRSNADNADLAGGFDRVLVLSPFGGRTRTPPAWSLDLATQVAALRAAGSRVETIFPDAAARAAFGEDAMDPSAMRPAALAGYEQGRMLGAGLFPFWS